MAQAGYALDSEFDQAEAPSRLPLALSIFADRAHVRAEIREDALGAGLRVGRCGELDMLLENDAIPLGEVVLIDCPRVDAARLAALSRLDMRVARIEAQMVVSTSVDALDDVFACLDQSRAQILVDPGRAERVVALGRALGRAANLRLRELSDEDRLQLLRITEQVEEIAKRLDRMSLAPKIGEEAPASYSDALAEGGALQIASPAPVVGGQNADTPDSDGEGMKRNARPALPDPRLVRRIIRQRHLRARFFDGELFGDPAWDILLDLTAARAEHARVSVTSLCIASGVPPTTALRWIAQMSDAGLLERVEDETDRRRTFIALSDSAADAMARYFMELGREAAQLV